MVKRYTEEAEDLIFDLFDEDDFSSVESFIESYGCEAVDRDGRNLLMNFIVEGKEDFAKELIDRYKDKGLCLDLQDDYGWTALHFAAQENMPEIIETLVAGKAKVDVREECGRSPLFISIFDRNDECAIALMKSGADLGIANDSGIKPITLATSKLKKWIKANITNT